MDNTNGVDLPQIGSYVDAVKADNGNAKVKFIARSEWKGGTQAEVTIKEYHANGAVASRPDREFKLLVDEPGVLGGQDAAPNPVEYLATALCGCLTAAISTNAAMFGNKLEKLEVETEVDFDLLGVLGMDRSVPNGALKLHYKVKLKGENKESTLRSKETIDRKSAIRNTLEMPLIITTEVEVED